MNSNQEPLGPPHDPLTLPLALNETFRLADAVASAWAATFAHEMALPLRLPTSFKSALPELTTCVAASRRILPCVWTMRTIAGRFFSTVFTTVWTSADALASQFR